MTLPPSDSAILHDAAASIAESLAHPPEIDGTQTAVWESLAIEAAILLIRWIASECKKNSDPDSVRRRAIAIRDRSWLNFGLRRQYNAIWYRAADALDQAGVQHDVEDVYRLADRLVSDAASSSPATIAACIRAASL